MYKYIICTFEFTPYWDLAQYQCEACLEDTFQYLIVSQHGLNGIGNIKDAPNTFLYYIYLKLQAILCST